MHTETDEFLDEQKKGLAEMARDFRKAQVAAARKATRESAVRIKAMNLHVRKLASTGVRLSSISQDTAERLIELQSEIVTSALDDAASQLQRIADTENVMDLARGQTEVLQATRQRIVGDIARTLKILKGAASDVRAVAKRTTQSKPAKARKAVRGKTRRAAKRAAATKPAARKSAARKSASKPRTQRTTRARRR